jgi:hypothetical protein
MGKKSHIEQTLGASMKRAPSAHQLAFFDANQSPVLRSIANSHWGEKNNYAPGVRKRGRPVGSLNRDNVLLSKLVNDRIGTDPLLVFCDAFAAGPEALAKTYGISADTAFKEWRAIGEGLVDRVHGKTIQRVEATGKDGAALPIFNVNFFDTPEGAADDIGFGFGQDVEFIGEIVEAESKVTDRLVTDESNNDASN